MSGRFPASPLPVLHHGLEPPELEMRTGDVLRSLRYGDRYSSADGPLEEGRYVFLSGSGLPERWAGRPSFVVAELGFGVARNFLLTRSLWRETRPPGAQLHYISFEAHPLARSQLEQAWSAMPELIPLGAE
jgi:tRNA 5-methylaminomethyl-2-thiouridine biosynthesis bifunctional protein